MDIFFIPLSVSSAITVLFYVLYKATIKKKVTEKYYQSNPDKVTIMTISAILILISIFTATALGMSFHSLNQIKKDTSYLTKHNDEAPDDIRYFDILGNEYECEHKIILYDENGIAYHQSDNDSRWRFIGDNGKEFSVSYAYLNEGGCVVCINTDTAENIEYTDNPYEIISDSGEHFYWALCCYWDIEGNLLINPDGNDKKIVITKERQEKYQLEHEIFLKNHTEE